MIREEWSGLPVVPTHFAKRCSGYCRLATMSSPVAINLPVGGWYIFSVQISTTSVGSGVNHIGAKILYPGGGFSSYQEVSDTQKDVTVSATVLTAPGDVYVQVQALSSSSPLDYTFTVDNDATRTQFTGTLIG